MLMIVDPDENTLKPGSEAAEFYAHVGRIISIWAGIESYVFQVFWFCLVTHEYKAALIFDRMGMIGQKMARTDDLAKATLEPKWYAKWKAVYKELDTLLALRNRLAHNPTNKMVVGVGGPDASQHRQFIRYYLETDRHKVHKTNIEYDDIEKLNKYLVELLLVTNKLSSLGLPRRSRRKPEIQPRPIFPSELFPHSSFPKKQGKRHEALTPAPIISDVSS